MSMKEEVKMWFEQADKDLDAAKYLFEGKNMMKLLFSANNQLKMA